MGLTFSKAQSILAEVTCEPYNLVLGSLSEYGWYLQARRYREDVIKPGTWGWGSGGKYYVSSHSTPEEIRQKALAACIAYAEHEVRESFKWRGRRIFGPHLDHEVLWEAADDTVRREEPI